ncbi:MAG TPA: CHAD domain-containing protein [Thermomicrobiales bacterium]|nr:CHAD domain-containing protein [Thermomicrobiales bacterium]
MTTEATRMIGAAIDIGSNSIKMTIARASDDGGFEQLDWASEVVRLGEGLDRTGFLDEQRIETAIETLRRFAAQARERGATRIVGVATEATRAAANGATFLERVRAEAGIDVRVIDGQDEAALTFHGLQASTDLTGSIVVADIGGGSTELISARDGAMQVVRSLPLGSGRLTDRLVVADPPRLDEIAACEQEAAAVIQTLPPLGLPSGEIDRLIVVGGTGEYMARFLADGQRIALDDVRTVLAKLLTLSAAELGDEIDIPEARARVLPAGVAIVAAIASYLRPNRIEISRSGVRTGLLLQALYDGDAAQVEDPPAIADAVESPNYSDGRQPNAERNRVDASFRETMRALIAERWRIVWEAIPIALEGTDIEGVHDVRVASRRLRAAMDVAQPAFPGKWYKSLHRTAKEITGALGEVRDRDVLLEALQRDRSAAPAVEHPGIDRLIDRVERERAQARAEMERFLRQLLDSPLWSELERRFGMTGAPADEPTGVEGDRS